MVTTSPDSSINTPDPNGENLVRTRFGRRKKSVKKSEKGSLTWMICWVVPMLTTHGSAERTARTVGVMRSAEGAGRGTPPPKKDAGRHDNSKNAKKVLDFWINIRILV